MIKYIVIILTIIILFIIFKNKKIELFSTYTKINTDKNYGENINYYKKKYIYDNVEIGYPKSTDIATIKKLATNFAEQLIKKTLILFVSPKPFEDVSLMIKDLIDKNNNLDFIIIDDISINNLFFKKNNNKKNYSKIRFISSISQEYIFPIVNIANSYNSLLKINKIGITDSYKNRFIVNDIKNIIELSTGKEVEIIFSKSNEDLLNKLNNFEIDVFLYIDNFPNKFVNNIFALNPNLAIIQTGFDSKLVKDTYGYYKQKVFDLNKINSYLPRKIKDDVYTRFKPDIILYQFNISVYTNSNTEDDVVYNMKKYLYNETKNNDVFSNFSYYFLNHSAVNKFLKEKHVITTDKNPNCAFIKNKCTPDMLKVVQTQIF